MARAIWLLVSFGPAVLLAAAGGCGDDESLPSAGPMVPDAGSPVPDSGTDPEAGGPRVNFGRRCERPEDCGIDLVCLASDSPSLVRGGPPRGLCTVGCDQDPSVCDQYSDNARCVRFGDRYYCAEACDYGSMVQGAFDKAKCHGRTEFACKPTLVDTRVPCEGDADCEDEERCAEGSCQQVLPTCMPQCNGDSDCDSQRFCDPRTGECVKDLPRGLRLSERCDTEASPDPCRGSCGLIERPDGARCDETCTLGAFPTCGLSNNPPSVGCAIPVLEQASYGDMGYCARLCDCSADCPSGLQCVASDLAYLQRPGLCKIPEAGDAVRSSCAGPDAGVTGTTTGSAGIGGSSGVDGGGGQAGAFSEGGAAGEWATPSAP